MARLAVEGQEGIIASDYEIHLSKPSYTWNTLQNLSKDYPDREFVLLMGGDNWSLFDKWYHYEDILKNYQIVIYPRRDCPLNSIEKTLSPQIVEAELLDISSTEIRQRLKEGKGIRRMVPKAVADFIKEKGLYAKEA